MADDWDDEDFELKPPTKPVTKDSWEDEEVEEVKESWDADDAAPVKAVKPVKKSASGKEVLKEAKKVDVREMTEEEKRMAQEEADFNNAASLFGVDKSLDEISLESRDDYIDYTNRLYAKLNKYHNNSNYQEFLEELFKSLCKNLPADTIRKVSNSFKVFADAKLAEEKQAKQKTAKPTLKAKGKLKVEKDVIKGDFDDFLKKDFHGYDDDEDDGSFM